MPAAEILQILRCNDPVSEDVICQQLGRRPVQVRHVLDELKKAGMAYHDRFGWYKRRKKRVMKRGHQVTIWE